MLFLIYREVEDKHMTVVPAAGHDIDAHIQAVKQSGYGVTVKQVSGVYEEYYKGDNIEISPNDKNIVAQTVWNLLNEKYSSVFKISVGSRFNSIDNVV